MMQIETTMDMAWIESKEIDRYWHLHPSDTNGNDGGTDRTSLSVRQKRIRRAQYAAVGALHGKV